MRYGADTEQILSRCRADSGEADFHFVNVKWEPESSVVDDGGEEERMINYGF